MNEGTYKGPGPIVIDDATMAFPVSISYLMPAWEDIPAEFRNFNDRQNKWLRFQRDWFFTGITKQKVVMRDGFSEADAFRHLAAIQRSYEPKHQHKEAAIAYLASLWFVDA